MRIKRRETIDWKNLPIRTIQLSFYTESVIGGLLSPRGLATTQTLSGQHA
jgi:hypothetical protein